MRRAEPLGCFDTEAAAAAYDAGRSVGEDVGFIVGRSIMMGAMRVGALDLCPEGQEAPDEEADEVRRDLGEVELVLVLLGVGEGVSMVGTRFTIFCGVPLPFLRAVAAILRAGRS